MRFKIRFTVAALLLALSCSAQANSFTGTWIHKDGKTTESVVIQPDKDGYSATSTTEPKALDVWGPFSMDLIRVSDQLLIDRETRENRWELLPDGSAKSYMRNKPEIFQRLK
ncbi:hypothetical protein [Pseudomonas sp. DC3000-4b1]|uniref:hypothetical protein n=1 Tax=unclassified Pseudomonas TaxID=196821 RepID=UPI003CE7342F